MTTRPHRPGHAPPPPTPAHIALPSFAHNRIIRPPDPCLGDSPGGSGHRAGCRGPPRPALGGPQPPGRRQPGVPRGAGAPPPPEPPPSLSDPPTCATARTQAHTQVHPHTHARTLSLSHTHPLAFQRNRGASTGSFPLCCLSSASSATAIVGLSGSWPPTLYSPRGGVKLDAAGGAPAGYNPAPLIGTRGPPGLPPAGAPWQPTLQPAGPRRRSDHNPRACALPCTLPSLWLLVCSAAAYLCCTFLCKMSPMGPHYGSTRRRLSMAFENRC